MGVPVYEGAATPLLRDDFPVPRAVLHARGQYARPPSCRCRRLALVEGGAGAVEFLIETYMGATEPITLVPVGPLTNIALAIRREPRIVERIPQVVIMGGAHGLGNTTPAAEFNIWVDPDAAAIVFEAGFQDLTLIPLDATHRAVVSLADCRRLRDTGTPAAIAGAEIIENRISAYAALQPLETPDTAPVHDALCVAFLVDPTVVSGRPAARRRRDKGRPHARRDRHRSGVTFRPGAQRLRGVRRRRAGVRVDARGNARPLRPDLLAGRGRERLVGRGQHEVLAHGLRLEAAQLLERDVAAHECPGSTSSKRRLGHLAEARGCTRGQRVWNTQPVGGLAGLGSRPRGGCAPGLAVDVRDGREQRLGVRVVRAR